MRNSPKPGYRCHPWSDYALGPCLLATRRSFHVAFLLVRLAPTIDRPNSSTWLSHLKSTGLWVMLGFETGDGCNSLHPGENPGMGTYAWFENSTGRIFLHRAALLIRPPCHLQLPRTALR